MGTTQEKAAKPAEKALAEEDPGKTEEKAALSSDDPKAEDVAIKKEEKTVASIYGSGASEAEEKAALPTDERESEEVTPKLEEDTAGTTNKLKAEELSKAEITQAADDAARLAVRKPLSPFEKNILM